MWKVVSSAAVLAPTVRISGARSVVWLNGNAEPTRNKSGGGSKNS